MGLIRAFKTASSDVIADQWKEYFYCDALPPEVLVRKGEKRITSRNAVNKGVDNIITNGSIIVVNAEQCMIIVEQGKIVEICAEPGEFEYDTSTEPSVLAGSLGKSIVDTFKTLGKRITFAGDTAKDQRIYYINTKEIYGNKYGTANPVPFRVVDTNIGLDIDIAIRCNGQYSYEIENPILFYTNVCGNIGYEFRREEIDSTLKSELLTALQPAFARISEMGVRYSALPAHTTEIAAALNEILSAQWLELRGIVVRSFSINSVTASKEDEEMIKQLQRKAVMRDPSMAAATLAEAQAEAMVGASKNEGGAMLGFMGLNMAQQAGGFNAQSLYQMSAQQQAQTAAQPVSQPVSTASGTNAWTCSCGTANTGKFCTECASPRPQEGWTCPSCGTVNKGKFCMECASPRPVGAPLYRCDKCGWEPEDPKNPPKFCPECGDRFDTNDVK